MPIFIQFIWAERWTYRGGEAKIQVFRLFPTFGSRLGHLPGLDQQKPTDRQTKRVIISRQPLFGDEIRGGSQPKRR